MFLRGDGIARGHSKLKIRMPIENLKIKSKNPLLDSHIWEVNLADGNITEVTANAKFYGRVNHA